MKKRTTNFCLLIPLDDPCLLTRIFINDSETLKRVESILSGPHPGAFCQIVDIFVSGFGKLNKDSDLLFVSLVYEEKTNLQTNVQKIMYSFTNYLKTNQFKVKTQNCEVSFVYLLLI